jgi:hypothetical protein
MRTQRKDIDGRPVGVGDTVRIVGMPDLSGTAGDCRKESEPVFQYLVGKSKKISDFNDLGMAELRFKIEIRGKVEMHTVWIETPLLRLKRK